MSHDEKLRLAVEALTRAGLVDEAIKAAYAIRDGTHERTIALLHTAQFLAWTGRHAQADAVFRDVRIPDMAGQERQAEALAELVDALVKTARVDKALEVARTIANHTIQVNSLSVVAQTLSRARRYDEALSVARTIPDAAHRARALQDLAADLTGRKHPLIQIVLDEAVSALREVHYNTSGEAMSEQGANVVMNARSNDAIDITPTVSDVADILMMNGRLSEAVEIAHMISDEADQAAALGRLAMALLELDHRTYGNAVLDEALAIVARGGDIWNLQFASETVTLALCRAGRLAEAREAAQAIASEADAAHSLREVTKAFVKAGDYGGALATARLPLDRAYQVMALAELGQTLADAGRHQQSTEIFLEGLRLSNALGNDERDRLSRDFVIALARTDHVLEAVEAAKSIKNRGQRESLLTDVVVALVGAERFTEAIYVTRLIPRERFQVKALNTIAAALSKTAEYPDAAAVFDEAATLARSIDDAESRVYALSDLADHLRESDLHKFRSVVSEVLETARAVPQSTRATALRQLAVMLASVGDENEASATFDEALKSAFSIESDILRTQSLGKLVRALMNTGRYQSAQRAISALPAAAAEDRLQFETELAVSLSTANCNEEARALLEESLERIRGSTEKRTRARELMRVAQTLAETDQDGQATIVFRETLAIVRSIEDQWSRAAALGELSVVLAEASDEDLISSVLGEAIAAVHDINDQFSRHLQLLMDLATSLAHAGHFKFALKVANAIQSSQLRDEVMLDVISALIGASDIDQAIEIADVIHDVRTRTTLLGALRHAVDLGRSTGRFTGEQAAELVALAQSLQSSSGWPQSGLGEAEALGLDEALQISRSLRSDALAAPAYDANDVQFSIYYPKEVRPTADWQHLLVYIFKTFVTEAVIADAKKSLGVNWGEFSQIVQSSRYAVPARVEITVTPELTGFQFEPVRLSVGFYDDWHRLTFKVRAKGAALNSFATGTLTFAIAGIIIAELPISISVTDTPAKADMTSLAMKHFGRIFCSYSHRDIAVVQYVEAVVKALGLDYLRDVATLRAGEHWNEALLQLIETAQIFQLFWSQASAESHYVEMEWKHALERIADGLAERTFIRPVYWQMPMPPPPSELNHIHFRYEPRLAECSTTDEH